MFLQISVILQTPYNNIPSIYEASILKEAKRSWNDWFQSCEIFIDIDKLGSGELVVLLLVVVDVDVVDVVDVVVVVVVVVGGSSKYFTRSERGKWSGL